MDWLLRWRGAVLAEGGCCHGGAGAGEAFSPRRCLPWEAAAEGDRQQFAVLAGARWELGNCTAAHGRAGVGGRGRFRGLTVGVCAGPSAGG